jgi:hypothetical protein
MKSISRICRRSMIVIGLAAAGVGAAHADEGLTRDQVKAELADAQRNGDISRGEEGLTLRQEFPQRYGVHAADANSITAPAPDTNATSVPRGEVNDELAQARRNGDISFGQQGLTMRERYPELYGRIDERNAAGSGANTAPAE